MDPKMYELLRRFDMYELPKKVTVHITDEMAANINMLKAFIAQRICGELDSIPAIAENHVALQKHEVVALSTRA